MFFPQIRTLGLSMFVRSGFIYTYSCIISMWEDLVTYSVHLRLDLKVFFRAFVEYLVRYVLQTHIPM